MNFKKAYQHLMEGKKITRKAYNTFYLKKVDTVIKGFFHSFDVFRPALDIISDEKEWFIDNEKEAVTFIDMLTAVNEGKKARLATWNNENYIYLSDKDILRYTEELSNATLYASDYLENDWEVIND